MLWLRTVLLTILALVLVPVALLAAGPGLPRLDLGPARWIGVLPLMLGLGAILHGLAGLIRRGRVTSAPGDPPPELVTAGLFRSVRNPHAAGVLLVAVGEAPLADAAILLGYAGSLAIAYHLFVRYHGEPALGRRFGEACSRHREAIPRWWPRRSRVTGDGERAESRPRLRLRGLAVLVLAVAAGLAVLRPFVREPLQRLERRARVRLNERDLYRHVDDGRIVAEGFAEALRSGRSGDARGLTTAGFQRSTGPRVFATLAARSPLSRQPSVLVEGVLDFSDGRGQFVSKYVFRCRGGDRVALILVTEAGRLRVDSFGPEEPTKASAP